MAVRQHTPKCTSVALTFFLFFSVKTNTIRNPSSARVSIPSIVRPQSRPTPNTPAHEWRTPLRSTAPYWASWFTGLSDAFLAVRAARLLVLAGTDRLDRPLMIGQMQGKFQMEVVPSGEVGHMLHEVCASTVQKLDEHLTGFGRTIQRSWRRFSLGFGGGTREWLLG